MCPKNGGQYTFFLGTPIGIYRVSTVYLSYIYRISTVIYRAETSIFAGCHSWTKITLSKKNYKYLRI